MTSEHRKFWSTIVQNYDKVVDLQIGVDTRAMARTTRPRSAAAGRRGVWLRQRFFYGKNGQERSNALIHDRADMGHGKIGAAAVFQMERLALVEYNSRQSYE